MPYEESQYAHQGDLHARFYQEALAESEAFKKSYKERKGVVRRKEMLWEDSPDGKIKHIINEKMYTTECALDMYMHFLESKGRSGKHRHMSEELFFVLEGKGYDLHWDVNFELDEDYTWIWNKEPRKFEWQEGDIVYVPPYTIHQHFNDSAVNPARLLITTSRVPRALGLEWFEQIENAPGY